MPAPESEWMLWAKCLRDELRIEQSQIKKDTGNAARFASLEEQLNDLTASYGRLDSTANELKDRTRALEKVKLESEWRSQRVLSQSRSDIADLKEEFDRVTASLEQSKKETENAIDLMHEDAKATKIAHEREIRGLREQIQLLAAQSHLMQHNNHAISLPSTETTAVPNSAETSDNHITRAPNRSEDVPRQGKANLADYLSYGDEFIATRLQQAESEAVKEYVDGMRENFRRVPLREKLEKQGWTWRNARAEIHGSVEEVKRRKRNRRPTDFLGRF